jgi:hypothetical protein
MKFHKSTSELIICKGIDDQVFKGRALFIMSLFHVVRQSMDSFTWSHEAFEGATAKDQVGGLEKRILMI